MDPNAPPPSGPSPPYASSSPYAQAAPTQHQSTAYPPPAQQPGQYPYGVAPPAGVGPPPDGDYEEIREQVRWAGLDETAVGKKRRLLRRTRSGTVP